MNKFDVTVAKELLELNANRSDVKNIVDIHFSVVYTLILVCKCRITTITNGFQYGNSSHSLCFCSVLLLS